MSLIPSSTESNPSSNDKEMKAMEAVVKALGGLLKTVWDSVGAMALGGLLEAKKSAQGSALDTINSTIKSMEDAGKSLESLDAHKIVEGMVTRQLPCISWNHAKLVVVNGKSLLTGGGNFWDYYQSDQHDIIDM